MARNLPLSLFLKSLLVGTPAERVAKQVRWLFTAKSRFLHPELWEVYLEEQRLPLILQRLLTNESCGVDVGSHIGSFLGLLMRYAPNGHHVAFEASPIKCEWLRRRFSDVEIFHYAVAGEAGSAVFEEDVVRPGYSHLKAGRSESGAKSILYEVQTCRLDDVLLKKDRIDLIKFDIEGGELAALRGAVELVEKCRPAIIFECGSEYFFSQQKSTRRDLYDFITDKLNYEIFSFADFLFDKGEMTFGEFRKCGLYPFRAFNFVALPQSGDSHGKLQTA